MFNPAVPTHVGVNLQDYLCADCGGSCPHACGGEPYGLGEDTGQITLSPRMWG